MVDGGKQVKEYGTIFLGKDEKTYGKEGTGTINYDPEFECGGPKGTTGRQCAFETKDYHTSSLSLTGSEGRKLHISIASYRDPLCPKTLYNLFTKAKHPDKIRIRVLEQSVLGVDVDCLKKYCDLVAEDKAKDMGEITVEDPMKDCPFADQIFIHHLDASEAAGPTWARGLLSADIEEDYKSGIVNTQDHCMSIDSHMDAEPEWDHKMVSMWDDAKNEYAVLSTYVVDVEHLGKNDLQVPHLCMVTFTSNVRTHATKCVTNLTKPKLTNAVWGAGLSFSKCHAELKVMVDPHTPHVFDGEEFNRAARFFTHGYDIYTPNRVYILHDYHKSQSSPTVWRMGSDSYGSLDESNLRLKTMIDVPGGESDPVKALKLKQSKYGLGDRRSLDQLIQFSGIDLRHGRPSIDGKNRCGNIQWVPFLEHPKGVNYIPKFNDKTEDPLDLPYGEDSIWYGSKIDVEALASQEKAGINKDNDADAGYVPGDNKLQKEHAELLKQIEAGESGDDGEVFVPEKNSLEKKHADLFEQLEIVKGAGSNKDDDDDEDAGYVPGDNKLQNEHAELLKQIEAAEINDAELVKSITNFASNDGEVANNIKLLDGNNVSQVGKSQADNNIIGYKAEIVKNNVRRRVQESLFSSKVIQGFLVNHSIVPPEQHGFQQLPAPVQFSVIILIIGFVISVGIGAGQGRAYIRKTRTL